MAFNVPTQSPLTGAQSDALSKIQQMNNLLVTPFKKFFDKPKSQQISLLDFITNITDAVFGVGYIDSLIMNFFNDLFDKNSEKLESSIIKAIAKALDSKTKADGTPISIKNGMSNEEWLTANVKPELHVAMRILKAILVKKAIQLMFGPKDKIKPLTLPPNNYGNNSYLTQNYTDLTPDQYLDNAALQDVMFTTVNVASNTYGDIEYNIVQLKEQLAKGIVTFTVSCQDVKINLPESVLESADAIIDNNIKAYLQGTTVGGGQATYQNPAGVLVELNGHVQNETQRINSEENAAAVRKSWIRIMLDKMINLLPIVLYPILQKILDKINIELQKQAAAISGSNVTPPANTPVTESIGETNGTTYNPIITNVTTTIVPGTLRVSFDSETFVDGGDGSLLSNLNNSGRIDYNTGIGSLETTLPTPTGATINATYDATPPSPFAINFPLLTVDNTLGLFTSIKDDAKNNRSLFDKNSTFYKILMNAIYSTLLTLLLKKVIPKITKLIAKALAKRKAQKLMKKYKRYQEKAKLLQEQAQEAQKNQDVIIATKALKVIYDYAQNSNSSSA
jgi:hypothetical protein